MATELRDKLEQFQINLLCDEYDSGGSKVTLPKVAIEGIIEALEKELVQYVYLVGHQQIAPKRFNTAMREWENILGVIFNAGTRYEDIATLSNGHIVAIRNDCRYIEIDPMTRRAYREGEYFGQRFPGDTHNLQARHDDRPEIYGIVRLRDDVFGMFDTALFKTYIEIDLLTGEIFKLEENDEDDPEDPEGEAAQTRRRLAHTLSEYYDVGGGKCLLVVDAEDDPPLPRKYFLIDVAAHTYREIPNPYPGEDETHGDKYIGMGDGSIFTIGNNRSLEGPGFAATARCSRFDLTANAWIQLEDAPITVENNVCVLLPGGDIMVLANENPTDNMLIYNPPTNTWTMTDSPFNVFYDEHYLVLI